MNAVEQMKEVLACFPGHSDKSIKAGDIILPQHLATYCKISPMQANEILSKLCEAGYLVYGEASEGKVAGYHLTEQGFSFYTKNCK